MSLIDSTYFIGEIALPTFKFKPITDYITRYENRVIYDLFGYTLGNLIIAYDSGTSPQKIKDIVEGKEYTISADSTGYYNPGGEDIQIKWNGLLNTNKVSLLAYWIYYWFCRENDSYITNIAGVKAKAENAENVGFTAKAAYSWNEMQKLYGFEAQPSIEPSCFNFMEKHIRHLCKRWDHLCT